MTNMGQYMSSDFTIYGRNAETNSYVLLEEKVQGNPMSRFKHETYAYALNKKHVEMKALYLYCGYNRICRVGIEDVADVSYVVLAFATAEAALEWDACKEQIPMLYVDHAWLERTFAASFVEMNDANVYSRRYQNYKMDMKK